MILFTMLTLAVLLALFANDEIIVIPRNMIRPLFTKRKSRRRIDFLFGTLEERERTRRMESALQANKGDSREVIAIKEKDRQIREYVSKIATVISKTISKIKLSMSTGITDSSAVSVRHINSVGGVNDGEEDYI